MDDGECAQFLDRLVDAAAKERSCDWSRLHALAGTALAILDRSGLGGSAAAIGFADAISAIEAEEDLVSPGDEQGYTYPVSACS